MATTKAHRRAGVGAGLWFAAMTAACGAAESGEHSNGVNAGSGGVGGASGIVAPPPAGGTGGGAGVGASGGAGGASGSAGANAGAGGTGGGDAGDAGSVPLLDAGVRAPGLPPVTDTATAGPFEVTREQSTGPSGSAWVVRPTELGRDGLRHPIFVWGPGAGTGPSQYTDHLEHWASHGFVVYSIVSTGNGTEMTAALDWLMAEDARAGSPYFGMLDVERIAVGGHSRGSLSTFAMADDPRVTTTVHVAGGSFDGNGANSLHAPAAYLCGEDDTLATPNCERDYGATQVPVFFTVMSSVDHVMAARSGLSPITAWLRWHLAGETERRGAFLDAGGQFTMGTWTSKSKNW